MLGEVGEVMQGGAWEIFEGVGKNRRSLSKGSDERRRDGKYGK